MFAWCIWKSEEETRSQLTQSGLFFLHDNGRPHVSSITTQFLTANNVRILPHPPYSPDLAPCDFWLFGYLKNKLSGQRFGSDEELHQVVTSILDDIPKNEGKKTFYKWLERLQTCINAGGDYFERAWNHIVLSVMALKLYSFKVHSHHFFNTLCIMIHVSDRLSHFYIEVICVLFEIQ